MKEADALAQAEIEIAELMEAGAAITVQAAYRGHADRKRRQDWARQSVDADSAAATPRRRPGPGRATRAPPADRRATSPQVSTAISTTALLPPSMFNQVA